ncbi:MAG: hypothetical protein HWN65_01660 [Candidatus Helarchaeota archaeon]|nr:hypothetical protein [Candidatus Helarchaeota archaeon]
MESLSDKKKIWQLEEVLLILFASGRFHNLNDMLLLSEIFERVFPQTNLIGFNGNKTFVSRQIGTLKKKNYLIGIGANVAISGEGRKHALNILNEKILKNEEIVREWNLYRKILARLPRVRSMWEKYLEDFLRRLNK